MKFGVIVFPGSNCDHDAKYGSAMSTNSQSEFIWHKETSLPSGLDCIIVPGGFSYGDYLRCGAVARFSPVMTEVIKFANNGGMVMGICNGFQILTESGLLPGALVRNKDLNFICKDVNLKVKNKNLPFTNEMELDQVITIPVAHGEGNYFADADTIKGLEDNNQIVFQYCGPDGELADEFNPNGSMNYIAGVSNKKGNVMGMMPHPDRSYESILGSADGARIFQSIAKFSMN